MEAINDSLAMSPLHPCVECGKRVQKNSKAVQCESCDKWCHIRCGTRIDATTYEQMVEGNVDLFWFCRVAKKYIDLEIGMVILIALAFGLYVRQM